MEIRYDAHVKEAFETLSRHDESFAKWTSERETVGARHVREYARRRERIVDVDLPWVHEILSDKRTTVVFPTAGGSGVESKDVLRRRAYLMKLEEQRKYDRMVSDVKHPRARLDLMPKRQGSLMHEMGVGLNILLASLTALFLGWWAGWSYFDRDNAKALFVGVLSMSAMLIAEIILYIARVRRVDRGRKIKREKQRSDMHKRAMRPEGPTKEALEARRALEEWLERKGIATPTHEEAS